MIEAIENAFDESGSHAGSRVLCVAGYIIDKEQVGPMEAEWHAVLNWKSLEHPLDYFRMSECAHGNGQFKGISRPHRINVETQMIGIIKRRTVQGLAVSVIPEEFEANLPKHPLTGSAYTFSANVLLAGVSRWIDTKPQVKRAAYFFEAGHESQPEANAIMTLLFKNKAARERHRYAGHAFVDKEQSPACQAADLLAWQWYTDRIHEMDDQHRRKDCANLLEHPHGAVHLGPDKLAALAERFKGAFPDAETFERLFLGDPPSRRPKDAFREETFLSARSTARSSLSAPRALPVK